MWISCRNYFYVTSPCDIEMWFQNQSISSFSSKWKVSLINNISGTKWSTNKQSYRHTERQTSPKQYILTFLKEIIMNVTSKHQIISCPIMEVSLPTKTFPQFAGLPELPYILMPVTDYCSIWMKGMGKMAVEYFITHAPYLFNGWDQTHNPWICSLALYPLS